MKPRFVIAMLLVLALGVPVSVLGQQSKSEKEIRAVIDELNQANLKSGAEAVPVFDKYYAEEYVRIFSNGEVYNKATILEGYRTGKTKVSSAEWSDIKIRLYRNTAVATGLGLAKGTVLGAEAATKFRWTRVFVKRGGVWQCVLYQTTRIESRQASGGKEVTLDKILGT